MVNLFDGLRAHALYAHTKYSTSCQTTYGYSQGKHTLEKTEALTKSLNLYIWAVGTLNQLFVTGSLTQIKFSKKWSSQWQKSILCDRPVLYSPCNFVLTLAFDWVDLYRNVALSFVALWTKKQYSSFFKNSFSLSENLFQS